MLSTNVLRQAIRVPTLARAASTAAPAPRRTYTRSSPTTYKRPTSPPAPTAKTSPAPAAPAAAAPPPPTADASLPLEDVVPEEAMPTPLAHTIDDIREPIPAPSPAQAAEAGAAAWAHPGVASGSFPSAPIHLSAGPEIDWTTSFHGLSAQAFSRQAGETLMRPLKPAEIEIKPDGLLYLPEILYRRILNQAFGPGGWGMVPRGEMTVTKNMVSREWALLAGGRLVAVARGEQTFFDPSGVPTASEGCKSNALMRCCKDLGIASELWDPGFIRVFKTKHCVEAWVEHVVNKKKARRWRKKENKFEYPYQEPKN